MAFGIGKPRVSPIAIDFGADTVKLLQIVSDDPPQLIGAACAVIPEEARTNPTSRFAFLNETVRALLKEAPFRGRRVVCSIPAYQTFTQNLSVPVSEDIPLEERVGVVLREKFMIEPTRMVLRCQDVGPVDRNGRELQEAVCLAAERGVVNRYLEIMHQAKLEVCGVQTESVALMSAYRYLVGDDEDDSTVLLIDLGAACTKLIIAHGMKLLVARSLPIGWDHMVRTVADANELEFPEARALLMAQAATPLKSDDEDTTFGGQTAVGTQLAESPVQTAEGNQILEDEIKICMRYHQQTNPDQPVEGVVFVGGGARHVNLCKTWAKSVNLPALVGDPTSRLMSLSRNKPFGVSFNESQPGWAVPMGLCLTETDI